MIWEIDARENLLSALRERPGSSARAEMLVIVSITGFSCMLASSGLLQLGGKRAWHS